MSIARLPENETERLQALRRYGLVRDLSSESFGRFTRIASQLFNAPIALVSFVDEKHQWLKGCVGFEADSTPRDVAFCAHAILSDDPFIVLDASTQGAFADNPLVTGPPHIRFYAGAPLITQDNFRLGTLCVIDTTPRTAVNQEQIARLQDLASLVVEQLELIRRTEELDRQRHREQETERRAALALEAGQMGTWEWSLITGHVTHSPRADQLFGFAPGAMPNTLEAWENCIHPEDRGGVIQKVEQSLRTKSEFVNKYRVVFPNGSIRWIKDLGQCIVDAAGYVCGAIGVCYDITGEKQAAAQLRTSEELFRGLSAASPVGIFQADLEGHVQYVNPRVEQIWDLPARELRELGWTNRVHPEDVSLLLSGWQKANLAGREFDHEYRLLLPDGTIRWIHGRSAVMHDISGHPIGVVGTTDDFTERKIAEQKLGHLQELLQLAVDTMPQRLFWKDYEGKFLGCNQAFALDMKCSSPTEIVGKDDFALFSSEQAEAFRRDDARIRKSGVGFNSVEEQWTVPGSSIEWVRTTKVPLRDHAGQIIGVLGTYEDITAEKQTANHLRRAKDAAESAARAKSEFLANMSHEIRTPLNAVLGMVSLLLTSPLNEEQRNWAETAQSSGEVLLSLLNNVLDLSKAESGKLTLERVPFNLRRTVAQCVELLKPQASLKGLTLEAEYPADLPANVVGDPSRVRQVLLNYLANAVKFTASGTVQLRVDLVSVAANTLRLRLAVSDTGEGISTAAQERLFKPFTQADSSTTRRFGGTGLGLCIAKQFTELMGGTVGLKSELGRGSIFWSELPFEKTTQDIDLESSLQEHLVCPLRRGRILLAEDNRVNQVVATRLLQNLGFQVQVAADGKQAVQLWAAEPPDLIFMDGQMPCMDGYQATTEIRARERERGLKRTPIVALTAHALSGDRERCLLAGMDDYLSKPIDVKALRRVLESWLPAHAVPELLFS